MKRLYKVREVGRSCISAACSSVYELVSNCLAGACPGVHESESSKGSYYVVGRQLSQQEIKDIGLAEKVGQGEGVVEVPRGLLKDLKIE